MKQVTLNFREVAVDGLPTESGNYAVIQSFPISEQANDLTFSAVHKLWNASDYSPQEVAQRHAIGMKSEPRSGQVKYWIPREEFNAAFKDGETP